VVCVRVEHDDIDHALLELLTRDGRATYSELSARVGLSIAATKRRVDRLCADGVITGFTANVDYSKLGWAVEAFVEVRFHGTVTPDQMMRSMSEMPEVQAVFTIAGDPDILVWMRARDHKHLRDVVTRLRQRDKAMGTKTLIVLDSWAQTPRREDQPPLSG
jgi:Lrp/AsnC family leucine-responsive transcriptional regulator